MQAASEAERALRAYDVRALNVVGGWHRHELEMFGSATLDHDARYDMALEWLEIDYDEGPISQVSRTERHQQVLDRLLDEGHAYRSTATKAINTAVDATPANISPMPNSRNQVDWWRKLKSP